MNEQAKKAALEAFKVDEGLPEYYGEEDFADELLEAWERWLRACEWAIEYATQAAYERVERDLNAANAKIAAQHAIIKGVHGALCDAGNIPVPGIDEPLYDTVMLLVNGLAGANAKLKKAQDDSDYFMRLASQHRNELEDKLERYRAALEFYANPLNYDWRGVAFTPYVDGKPMESLPVYDEGCIAREALKDK